MIVVLDVDGLLRGLLRGMRGTLNANGKLNG